METLQSWALCITFSAVGALLVHALVPKGATEKAIRVMISLFLLSAILSPFLSGKGITLTLPDQGTGDLEAQVEAAQEKNKSYPLFSRRQKIEEAAKLLASAESASRRRKFRWTWILRKIPSYL